MSFQNLSGVLHFTCKRGDRLPVLSPLICTNADGDQFPSRRSNSTKLVASWTSDFRKTGPADRISLLRDRMYQNRTDLETYRISLCIFGDFSPQSRLVDRKLQRNQMLNRYLPYLSN